MKFILTIASLLLFVTVASAQEAALSADLRETKITKTNKKLDAQFNEASPVISQALEVHRCLKRLNNDFNGQLASLRALNPYLVPGLDATKMQIDGMIKNLAPAFQFQYASQSKCVGISQIDSIAAVANNALSFRVVYLATDSGETTNFWYKTQKQDNGDWKILAISASGYFF